MLFCPWPFCYRFEEQVYYLLGSTNNQQSLKQRNMSWWMKNAHCTRLIAAGAYKNFRKSIIVVLLSYSMINVFVTYWLFTQGQIQVCDFVAFRSSSPENSYTPFRYGCESCSFLCTLPSCYSWNNTGKLDVCFAFRSHSWFCELACIETGVPNNWPEQIVDTKEWGWLYIKRILCCCFWLPSSEYSQEQTDYFIY